MKNIEDVKKLFNTNKEGGTYCFSLVCWTDGMWSVEVTDDWHKWSDENIPKLNFKYATAQIATNAFFKFIKDNKINLKKLQSL